MIKETPKRYFVAKRLLLVKWVNFGPKFQWDPYFNFNGIFCLYSTTNCAIKITTITGRSASNPLKRRWSLELGKPFKFPLVGKFTHERPKIVRIRSVLHSFSCQCKFQSHINGKHIIVHFEKEGAFTRLCSNLQPILILSHWGYSW